VLHNLYPRKASILRVIISFIPDTIPSSHSNAFKSLTLHSSLELLKGSTH